MSPSRKALTEKYGSYGSRVVRSAAGQSWLDGLDETTRQVWLNLNRIHRRDGVYGHHGGYRRVMQIQPEKTLAQAIVTGATVRGALVVDWMERFARCDVGWIPSHISRARCGAPARKRKLEAAGVPWAQFPRESKPYVERMLMWAAKARVA